MVCPDDLGMLSLQGTYYPNTDTQVDNIMLSFIIQDCNVKINPECVTDPIEKQNFLSKNLVEFHQFSEKLDFT